MCSCENLCDTVVPPLCIASQCVVAKLTVLTELRGHSNYFCLILPTSGIFLDLYILA